MNYIKPLDSLRAIAVLLVILTHWFPEGHPVSTYTSFFNGVDIFFTLSGFLITRILLQNRTAAEENGTRKPALIKRFFIRRTLRIFPIYYLTVLFLFILGPRSITHIRESVLWFLTYTSNFYFHIRGAWDGILSHYWSLAVEEQFYLVWPWLMLFVRKKYLLPVIIAFIAVGLTGQYVSDEILTYACFDGLGLGALLAWVAVYKLETLKKIYRPLLAASAIACILQVVRVVSNSTIVPVPSRTLTAICTITVITGVLLQKHEKTLASKLVLNNKALIWMGKISYGIYLYHLMVPQFASKYLSYMNAYLPFDLYRHNASLLKLENFCLLLCVAYASWKIIEQPVLRLKNRFEYQHPNRLAPAGVFQPSVLKQRVPDVKSQT